jgi:hypothetical protein
MFVVPPPETTEDPRVQKFRDAILRDYRDSVFRTSIPADPPVRGPYGYAHIPLKEGATPIRQKPFALHGERLEAYKKVAQDWIEKGKVEKPSRGRCEWLCQGFPVPKKAKEGEFPWRGVVDLRGPNSQTRRDNYPLPRIEDLLVKQGVNKIFSIIDLTEAFHQQPLHPDSRHITCTYTPLGIYQWKVNVMGLMNASGQFQQMLDDQLLAVADVANGYIDDVAIGTKEGDPEEREDALVVHDKALRRVLEVMKEKVFVGNEKKAHLFVEELNFCGQILGHGVRRPAPGKLMAIEKWELPPTITALRAFLGFTNQYNIYLPDYAELAAPLQEKLKVSREEGKKGSKKRVEWNEEEIACFEALKQKLCGKLILQCVNPDRPFILRVDSSGRAVGAVLEQLREGDDIPTFEDVKNKRTVPVAFLSRKLTATQIRSWTPRELETYAIILALLKWHSWIGLQPILVLTDHQSLEAWARETLDTPSGPIGRRARWHQILSKFDLTVGYVPGKDNSIADILSRWAYPASQAFRDISKHGSKADDEEMREIIEAEREEEKQCMLIKIKQSNPATRARVVTRSGRDLGTPHSVGSSDEESPPPSEEGPSRSTLAMRPHLPPGRKLMLAQDRAHDRG